MIKTNKVEELLDISEKNTKDLQLKKEKIRPVKNKRRRIYLKESREIKSKTLDEFKEKIDIKKHESINEENDKWENSKQLIEKYVNWTMGIGVIPIPFVGVFFIISLQKKMILDLAKIYNISCLNKEVKVGRFLKTFTVDFLIKVMGLVALKFLPFIIGPLTLASNALLMGNFTYALGLTFSDHFATGGDIDNLETKEIGERCSYYLKIHQKNGLA